MPDRLPAAALAEGVNCAEPGQAAAEPGPGAREAEPSRPVGVDDRLVRALGIPGFGLVIPHVVGLWPADSGAALRLLGSLWFVGLAAAIWHGNRWLLFEQRRHYGWFDHPIRKPTMLLGAIVLFTAPLTVAWLAAWYGWLGGTTDWEAIRTVVLINVICVVFVTHAYETVFLIKERETDLLRVAELDRARVEAELAAFLAQIDPHFLFNSLNTLGHLIEIAPARARRFTDDLADVYRYLLRQRGNPLVTADQELAFLLVYVDLMRIRFGDALDCRVVGDGPALAAALVPPTALQLLVENAIKHNEVGEGRPLAIEVRFDRDAVTVSNPIRPRRTVRPSAGVGLRNLNERSRLASGRAIEVTDRDATFTVRVPLIAAAEPAR